MQDIHTHKEPLGLGGLFRTLFGIYSTHFWQIYSTAILLALIPMLVSLALLGPSATLKRFADTDLYHYLALETGLPEATGQSAEATGDESADDRTDTPAQTGTGDQSGGDQAAGTSAETGDGDQSDNAGQEAGGATQPSIDQDAPEAMGAWPSLSTRVAVEFVVHMLAIMFFGAATALFVFDLTSGKDARFSNNISTALLRVIPLILVNFITLPLILLGFLLLLVPGLWLFGVLCVTAPAVVIEGRVFSAIGRSAALTKGYRWPCLGYVLSLLIIVVFLTVSLTIVSGLSASLLAPLGETLSALLALLVSLILFALILPISVLASPVLYFRLRELKGDPA
ncbi:MAG: hypothetical protein NXH97_17625 [Rhodobacteraceae bacterium]|nr:hypothetical protein [Paracoccaceae bacterium]